MTPATFKTARIKLGLTQQALADLLGRNIATLQRWEAEPHKKSAVKPPQWACWRISEMMKGETND